MIGALRARLADADAYVADAAAAALSSHPEATLPVIADALGDPDAWVRRNATRAVQRMGAAARPTLPRLLEMLSNDTRDNRLGVIEALRAWPPDEIGAAAPMLETMLEDPTLRCAAARLLARLGNERGSRALPVLIDLMREKDDSQGMSCANQAYLDVPRLGLVAIRPLVELLQHPRDETRRAAIIALGDISPPTDESIAAIARTFGDEAIRATAAQILSRFGPEAVPSLVATLERPDAGARQEAALALGRMGTPGRDAAPALVARLPAENGEVREAIVFALGRIGGPATRFALPELRRLLREPDVRVAAAEALARIAGAEAADVAPILIAALPEQTTGICPHPTAHEALGALGISAVPAIVSALEGPSSRGQDLLLRVLDGLGPSALEAARNALHGLLNTPRAMEGAKRLVRLDGVATPEMIEVFVRALDSPNPWFRLDGAEGLSLARGPSRALAAPILRELLDHEYEEIRARSAAALDRIEPD